MAKHVAVLMGGWSAEREVSLNSGKAFAGALESEGYRVTRIDVDRELPERLKAVRPDVCFNALHGKGGEDGTVQGVLETLEIPYTHSGILASALAMNKAKAKIVFADAGIPVAEHRLVPRLEAAKAHVMPPPYVIKPVAEGSSVGAEAGPIAVTQRICHEECPEHSLLSRPRLGTMDSTNSRLGKTGLRLCLLIGDDAIRSRKASPAITSPRGLR